MPVGMPYTGKLKENTAKERQKTTAALVEAVKTRNGTQVRLP